MTLSRFLVHLAFLILVVFGSSNEAQASQDYDLIWSSTGGGWRSMVADMAMANLLGQVGAITPETSSVSSISTNSGASWFSLQFFYSQVFFNRTLTSSPTELGQFVSEWMLSYESMFANVPNDPTCGFSGSDEYLLQQFLGDQCDIFVYFGGDWANFTQVMLETVSEGFGDAGLANRPVSFDNRVEALRATNLMIQLVLAANSRVVDNAGNESTASYLGPASSDGTVYTSPITVQYTVTDDSTEFHKVGEDILSVYTGPSAVNFTLRDYSPFFLYPPPRNASLTIPTSSVPERPTKSGQLREPFGGAIPTVNQVAGPSSAALGGLSGLVPSLMAQLNSVVLHSIRTDNTTDSTSRKFIVSTYLQGLDQLYNSELVNNVAVCSQWPDPCTGTCFAEDTRRPSLVRALRTLIVLYCILSALDGVFVDGGYTDALSLALNVGHYHETEGDLDNVLKIILTNTNEFTVDTQGHPILAYFSNPDNRKVKPGAYLWPPESLPGPSYQIFQESLTYESLMGLTEPIAGSNLTTAVLQATTIKNSAYGILPGQNVEILLVNLNAAIPTVIVGRDAAKEFVEPLAEMAVHVASSDELRSRVGSFVAPVVDSESLSSTTRKILSNLVLVLAVTFGVLWY